MKIGVFDSGIGGLTVLRELTRRFPNHDYAYFGDTANVPYGTKSVVQIRQLSRSAAERMRDEDLDLLVVACNTASSLALPDMQEILGDVPVHGVVEAGVAAVRSEIARSNRDSVLILGTRATVRSHIYRDRLTSDPLLFVNEQACPLLVPMIEEGWRTHPILLDTIREYTREHATGRAGVALLACTHYPFILDAFRGVLPEWKIIDSATAVADLVGAEFSGADHPTENPSEKDTRNYSVRLHFSDPDAVTDETFAFLNDQTSSTRFSVLRSRW